MMKVTGRPQSSRRPGSQTTGGRIVRGRSPVEVGTLLDYDPRHQITLLLVLVPSCPTSTFSFSAIETNSGGPAHKTTASPALPAGASVCRQAGRPGHKNLAARSPALRAGASVCSGHRPREHKSSILCGDLDHGQHKINSRSRP
jgi:hypothetical protein